MNLPPPRKSLGQHFLRDPNFLQRIVKCAQVSEQDIVLEIGPGRGALTEKLLTVAGGVVAIEVDRMLAAHLRERFSGVRLMVYEADITTCDVAACLAEARTLWGLERSPARVVANLPYNLSSPILTRLIEQRDLFTDFTVMLQREVVDRISSPPGNKTYGYFSVIVQAYCEVVPLCDVPPQAFFPPPKVWSSVVKLTPRATPLVAPEDEPTFLEITSAAFGQRRKMLGKVLASLVSGNRALIDIALRQAGIDPQQRAETLSVADFARLARQIRQARP